MSQVSSQVQDLNLVSISFAKFSHNTSMHGRRNFIWNHIGQRDDLDLIIRNIRLIDEYGNYATRVVMKITAGIDELETQDLGQLVNFAREFDPYSGAEYPVQVVIRSPFMAMRYPKSTNAVRRIQLKFRNEWDFREVLNVLKELGFPITESRPNSASDSRPSISPIQASFSSASTSRSTIEGSALPTSSIRSSLPALTSLSAPAAKSPLNYEFKVPICPDTTISDIQRPSSSQSFSTASTNRPASASTTLSAPTPPSSAPLVSPIYGIAKQVHSLYPNQHEREPAERRPSYPILQTANLSDITKSPLFLSQHETPHQVRSDRTQTYDDLLVASPFFSSRKSGVPLNPPRPVLDPRSGHEDTNLSENPTSIQLKLNDTLNDWIPPRRELPFPKRRESDRDHSSSTLDLPSLPKPTPLLRPNSAAKATISTVQDITATIAKQAKMRVTRHKLTAIKSPERQLPLEILPDTGVVKEANKDRGISAQEDEKSPLAAKSSTAHPSSAASGLQSKATVTKKRPAPGRPSSASKKPKMVDQGTQTKTLSGRDHTAAMKTVPNNDLSSAVVVEEPPGPPQIYLDALNKFITQHKSRPPPKELWERPGYAEADEEQRQLILNDFICENLENSDFLLLCEDTEKAWRTIGFGT